jgi:integrase
MNLLTGTALNRDLPSIAPSFFGTESTWNNGASLQQRSTSAWPRSGVWRTRQLIPASSVPNLPPVSAGVKGVRRIGVRLGNWLTTDQGRSLLLKSQGDSLRSKRNYAILAFLIGCGLRRGELLALSAASVQLREEHWVIADLHGKAGHIRTVPIPLWVKEALDR